VSDFRRAAPSGEDSTATKPELWRPLADAIGGFDLDPAAGCEPEAIAAKRYTPAENGLEQPWHGVVWLNPPFSEKTRWYKRLVDQYRNGDVTRAVVVAPVDTSTDWFHTWFARADSIGLLDGRNWFMQNGRGGGHESFSTMIGVWNPTPEVVDALNRLGMVYEPVAADGKQTTLTRD